METKYKKKILVLSSSTGSGHNRAAEAIIEAWEAKGMECKMFDILSFFSEKVRETVVNLYNGAINSMADGWGILYRTAEITDKISFFAPTYWFNSTYAKKLYEHIKKEKYDAVVCTHMFSMETVTKLKREGYLKIPSFAVITDYAMYPFVAKTDVDYYFVSCPEVKAAFLEHDFSEDRIIVSGIPVSAKFSADLSKEEARKQLGLPVEGDVYLIMMGGTGFGNANELTESILKKSPKAYIVVFTGNNSKLKEEFEEEYSEAGNVIALGFTDKVHLYMRAGDVLLTKPGGLSSTEACVANIPLVHTNAIPGLETENLEYFIKKGMSATADNAEDFAEVAYNLINDKVAATTMRKAQTANTNANSAKDIAEFILEKVQ